MAGSDNCAIRMSCTTLPEGIPLATYLGSLNHGLLPTMIRIYSSKSSSCRAMGPWVPRIASQPSGSAGSSQPKYGMRPTDGLNEKMPPAAVGCVSASACRIGQILTWILTYRAHTSPDISSHTERAPFHSEQCPFTPAAPTCSQTAVVRAHGCAKIVCRLEMHDALRVHGFCTSGPRWTVASAPTHCNRTRHRLHGGP